MFSLLLCDFSFAYSTAPVYQNDNPSFSLTQESSHSQLLAENEKDKREESHHPSGSLVLPLDSGKKQDKEGKKCMTVCTRWGQDCIIDPARGRKCRRTCKEFGEECF